MSELSSKEASRDFSTVLNRVAFGGERVVVTRRGKRLAAVVTLADLAQLERCAAAKEPPRP